MCAKAAATVEPPSGGQTNHASCIAAPPTLTRPSLAGFARVPLVVAAGVKDWGASFGMEQRSLFQEYLKEAQADEHLRKMGACAYLAGSAAALSVMMVAVAVTDYKGGFAA